MIAIEKIKNLDNINLEPYKTLRQSVEHLKNGIFVAEGEKVVRRLLESTLQVISVLTTPEWFKDFEKILIDRDEEIKVFLASKELLETIVGFNLHQGILALGKIPIQPNLEKTLLKVKSPYLLVAIDGLTNSENIGVLVRNCAAFGVQGILVGETSSSPYLRRAVRNSMGAIFKIPVFHCDNLVNTLKELKQNYKFFVIAAHPHSENSIIEEKIFSRDCCIVFGSEGEGISDKVLSVCDLQIAIPMQLNVDSLNVASASAVFLYEVVRQRRLSGGK